MSESKPRKHCTCLYHNYVQISLDFLSKFLNNRQYRIAPKRRSHIYITGKNSIQFKILMSECNCNINKQEKELTNYRNVYLMFLLTIILRVTG